MARGYRNKNIEKRHRMLFCAGGGLVIVGFVLIATSDLFPHYG